MRAVSVAVAVLSHSPPAYRLSPLKKIRHYAVGSVTQLCVYFAQLHIVETGF